MIGGGVCVGGIRWCAQSSVVRPSNECVLARRREHFRCGNQSWNNFSSKWIRLFLVRLDFRLSVFSFLWASYISIFTVCSAKQAKNYCKKLSIVFKMPSKCSRIIRVIPKKWRDQDYREKRKEPYREHSRSFEWSPWFWRVEMIWRYPYSEHS